MFVYEGEFIKTLAEKLISEDYRVYVPDSRSFIEYEKAKDIPKGKTRKSIKEFLLPQNEVLIRYGKWIEEVPLDREKRALIGVNPCDAKAVTLLDKIYLEGLMDPYYQTRRENTLIVSRNCEPNNYCFCESFGLTPFSTEGSDIFLIEKGERTYIIPVTSRGEKILSSIDGLMNTDVDESSIIVQHNFSRKVNPDIQDELRKKFDDEMWKRISLNCISCGTCTFLCPTCFCFDMLDEGEKEGFRYRAWDSCQFPLYTLESSSHNPRREKWQRLRNRFYDKFLYTVESKGEIFCVGCGRCIEFCPGGIDITEILAEVEK
jgi:ferredoxin